MVKLSNDLNWRWVSEEVCTFGAVFKKENFQ